MTFAVGSEEQQVYTWRFNQLWDAGYESSSAELIAKRVDIDLHKAVDLKQAGVADTLALDILL